MQLTVIQQKIYETRNHRVMLDRDLATLFGIETRALKQAVKRNLDRFPKDFMFKLTTREIQEMVSQNVIPSKSYFGGAVPFAFTEHGVTMLANVLKSKRAIQMSIAIVRAFVALKQFALDHKELAEKIAKLERKYNCQFKDVYEALNLLLDEKQNEKDWKERERIGYK